MEPTPEAMPWDCSKHCGSVRRALNLCPVQPQRIRRLTWGNSAKIIFHPPARLWVFFVNHDRFFSLRGAFSEFSFSIRDKDVPRPEQPRQGVGRRGGAGWAVWSQLPSCGRVHGGLITGEHVLRGVGGGRGRGAGCGLGGGGW